MTTSATIVTIDCLKDGDIQAFIRKYGRPA
jgi:hypothetical protein